MFYLKAIALGVLAAQLAILAFVVYFSPDILTVSMSIIFTVIISGAVYSILTSD